MKLLKTKNKKGFTLIELVIYIGIASVMLSLVVTLYISLVSARTKVQTISEVETQGLLAMSLMTQAVRNAQDVTLPVIGGATTTNLSLQTYLASTTSTVFDLASSTLRITEGTNPAIALTNNQVLVSNLSFQNLSASTTFDSVKIVFTVSYATTSGRYDSAYSKTFYDSATMRKFQ